MFAAEVRPIPRPWRPALLPTALLALLASAPARAIVVVGGATLAQDFQAEALAHDEGKKLRDVVGLEILRPKGPGELAFDVGTGVFLGFSEDQRTGAILTAAHLFCKGDLPSPAEEKATQVLVCFGHQILNNPGEKTLPPGIRVAGTRVILHPEHKARYAPSGDERKDGAARSHLRQNDLAILEFDATAHREALIKAGVAQAVLYEGKGYRDRPLLEARIAGFGGFATSASAQVVNMSYRIHSGHTRVTFATLDDRPAFFHWSPLDPLEAATIDFTDPKANLQPFTLQPDPMEYVSRMAGGKVLVQSHPKQALFVDGDSGSPLYFQNNGILKVAGIASGFLWDTLTDGSGTKRPFALQFWEPVVTKLDWIQAVRKGEPGASRVLKLADPKPDAGTPATGTGDI